MLRVSEDRQKNDGDEEEEERSGNEGNAPAYSFKPFESIYTDQQCGEGEDESNDCPRLGIQRQQYAAQQAEGSDLQRLLQPLTAS